MGDNKNKTACKSTTTCRHPHMQHDRCQLLMHIKQMQTSRLRQSKLSTYLKFGIKYQGWINVCMWTHSSIFLWKPTQNWDWVVILKKKTSSVPQHLTKSPFFILSQGENNLVWVQGTWTRMIGFIAVRLSSLYAVWSMHRYKIISILLPSLSLSSSSNILHAVSSLKNYILWHQFQFSLHWQVSFHISARFSVLVTTVLKEY